MSTLRALSLRASSLAVASVALFFTSASHAHINLQTKEAPVGSSYKAVFTVPHGCKGAATVKIRVRVPEGVIGVKPQPKVGWVLETVKGNYAQSHELYGRQVGSGVQEVVWSGGPLLDEHYDEFVLVGYLSDKLAPDTTLYFPVVQACEEGEAHWTEVPAADHHGTSHDHSASPAPALKLTTKP